MYDKIINLLPANHPPELTENFVQQCIKFSLPEKLVKPFIRDLCSALKKTADIK